MTFRARSIFLTGATGLLGRYLLRDLLAAGHRVIVLVRNSHHGSAETRVAEILEFWKKSSGHRLPTPVIMRGDVREERLGLSADNIAWLGMNVDAVVHSAASLAFRTDSQGEPFATNLGGTKNLVELCRQTGITEFHHVSTAFVCGRASGVISEDDTPGERSFRNAYEQSKHEAEQLVREHFGKRGTIYRPSVIIGDSQSGHTSSYHGMYRFMGMAATLAGQSGELALRLPMTGEEPRNLVTVDWVSQVISRLITRPKTHGCIYHLVSPRPVCVRMIKEVAEKSLRLRGVSFGGPDIVEQGTSLEKLFVEKLEEYLPYLDGDPDFDARRIAETIPDLPATPITPGLIARMVEFAVADRWGRGPRREVVPATISTKINCREYLENTFPVAARLSPLARQARLNVAIGLEVRGTDGGQWTLNWESGELGEIRRGINGPVEVHYGIDHAVFEEIVGGRLSPAEAFFARRIEVTGDLEKGLKLAMLLGHFLVESNTRPREGTAHAR